MNRIIIITFILLIGSCTHYSYVGTAVTEVSDGTTRDTQVYWGSTKPLLGPLKTDGHITLNIECSDSVDIQDTPEGLVFFADPGRSLDANGDEIQDQYAICGKVISHKNIPSIDDGILIYEFYCSPLNDDFSTNNTVYPLANFVVHQIKITKQSNFSLFGNKPAPDPITCER